MAASAFRKHSHSRTTKLFIYANACRSRIAIDGNPTSRAKARTCREIVRTGSHENQCQSIGGIGGYVSAVLIRALLHFEMVGKSSCLCINFFPFFAAHGFSGVSALISS